MNKLIKLILFLNFLAFCATYEFLVSYFEVNGKCAPTPQKRRSFLTNSMKESIDFEDWLLQRTELVCYRYARVVGLYSSGAKIPANSTFSKLGMKSGDKLEYSIKKVSSGLFK
jgi:hypothetical protein